MQMVVRMSEEELPAPVSPVGGRDVDGSTTSVPTDSVPAVDVPSPCLMTSSDVCRVGSADSDSGGSLSSSASPAPPPSTATHDEWNTNEPSDGADSGVGANGSTPVDGESLGALTYDGPVTTGSPAYMLSPPYVPAQYPSVPSGMQPSVVGTNGQASVIHTPIATHPLCCEDQQDGCAVTTGSSTGPSVMSPPGTTAPAANATPSQQQYVVNVHVNAGETFSVRAGDRVQLIHGNQSAFYLIL